MKNNSLFFFVLASLGAAIGIGNIWAYPYYSFKFTGLFFLPYLISLVALGLPLLILEFSVGQYFNKNVVDLFSSVKKWLSGIGWFMLFNAFILMSIYAVILSWHIVYLFASFGQQWKKGAKAYFFQNVLQASEGFNGFAHFSLLIFIALIVAWALIFFYVKNGFESLKRRFFITMPIFIFLMLLCLAYSLSLDYALSGINSFLKPNLKNLMKLDVWISAFSLAAVSLGLSFGIFHSFARKTEKGFLIGNSLIIVAFEILITIAIGLTLFSILGFLGAKQNASIENLIGSDVSYPFTTLAQSLPLLPKASISSLIFFTFLLIFFIFGTVSLAYALTHVLVHKFKTKHRNAAIITAGFGFLFGLVLVIKPGYYIMDIISHFFYYNILIALLLETIAIGWFFESQKIADFINQTTSLKIGNLWRFMIKYIIPLIFLALLFVQVKSDFLLNYKGYPLLFNVVFGIGIVVFPLVIAFLMPQKILDRK